VHETSSFFLALVSALGPQGLRSPSGLVVVEPNGGALFILTQLNQFQRSTSAFSLPTSRHVLVESQGGGQLLQDTWIFKLLPSLLFLAPGESQKSLLGTQTLPSPRTPQATSVGHPGHFRRRSSDNPPFFLDGRQALRSGRDLQKRKNKQNKGLKENLAVRKHGKTN